MVPSAGSATCYTYNSLLQLTAVKTGTGSSCTTPTTVGTYTYYPNNLRRTKVVGGTTSTFYWDTTTATPQLLQETAGSSTTSYVYDPVGAPLMEILPSGASKYYSHDQLGSVRAVTNSSGTTDNTDTYDPYGNINSSTGSTQNHLLYGGQYQDSETGLYYLRARYYDPTTTQFMTIDPAVALTMSPYGYASGNPLNLTDPTGLTPTCDPGTHWSQRAGDCMANTGGGSSSSSGGSYGVAYINLGSSQLGPSTTLSNVTTGVTSTSNHPAISTTSGSVNTVNSSYSAPNTITNSNGTTSVGTTEVSVGPAVTNVGAGGSVNVGTISGDSLKLPPPPAPQPEVVFQMGSGCVMTACGGVSLDTGLTSAGFTAVSQASAAAQQAAAPCSPDLLCGFAKYVRGWDPLYHVFVSDASDQQVVSAMNLNGPCGDFACYATGGLGVATSLLAPRAGFVGVGADAPAVATSLSTIGENAAQGFAAEQAAAEQLTNSGWNIVGQRVWLRTGLGVRVTDIVAERVGQEGTYVGFEVKSGGSVYLSSQVAKDQWIADYGAVDSGGNVWQYPTVLLQVP